jgi:hypothetical protein
MWDVRWQQYDLRPECAVVVAAKVEAQHTVVQDQKRPHAVGMDRIGVLDEMRMEDLRDPGDVGTPRGDRRSTVHGKNVQDGWHGRNERVVSGTNRHDSDSWD